jgi:formylglycine-generating enzyme required for sulfatase activity
MGLQPLKETVVQRCITFCVALALAVVGLVGKPALAWNQPLSKENDDLGKTSPGKNGFAAPDSERPKNQPETGTALGALKGQKTRKNSLGMTLVRIEPGSFRMGPHYTDSDSQKRLHSVTIRYRFYMADTKVTQAQFAQLLGRNPSYFSSSGGGKDKVPADTGRYPVESVTYYDALEACNKLSAREGLKPCYQLRDIRRDKDGSIKASEMKLLSDSTGYRLPSQAEWEYCARAGTTTLFSFGKTGAKLGEYAWTQGNCDGRTHPVGTKKPNPWGLYDMGGLLYEWCDDHWHGGFSERPPTDGSAWMTDGDDRWRVVVGGSWDGYSEMYVPGHKEMLAPGRRDNIVGFRVVLVAP